MTEFCLIGGRLRAVVRNLTIGLTELRQGGLKPSPAWLDTALVHARLVLDSHYRKCRQCKEAQREEALKELEESEAQ